MDLPFDLLPDDYVLLRIEASDDIAIRTVAPGDLPDGWREPDSPDCRPLGDA